MNRVSAHLYDMLSQLSTEQLDERLAQELHKDSADENMVQTVLAVLRDRERAEAITITPAVKQAWEKFQADSRAIAQQNPKPKRFPGWLLRVASLGLVVILLFAAIPQQAQADNFWERLVRWTDSVFEYFSPHAKEAIQEEYVFQTDHSGLQQVYDALVDLGVTVPVVPMWIPEGYELVQFKADEMTEFKRVHASFSTEDKALLLEVRIHNAYAPGQYQKNDTEIIQYEFNGTDFHIIQNHEMWIVTWLKDNIECYFTIDCPEDDLYQILRSIYRMEGSV